MPAQGSEAVTVCGRTFPPVSEDKLETIHGIIAGGSAPTRSAIARRICEVFGWRTPAGRPKEMSCRVALLRGNGNGKRFRPRQEIEDPERKVQ